MYKHPGFYLLLLLILGLSCALAKSTERACIHNDATHSISCARNLLAGEGMSTDVAYYDLQHRLGRLPVPITDWPPGFPLLLTLFVAVGIDGMTAVLLINYLCVFAIVWIVWRVLKLLKLQPTIVWAASGLLLLYVPLWRFARDGGSTMPMVVCSLLAFHQLLLWDTGQNLESSHDPLQRQSHSWHLVLCGMFAAATFSMRYAGLFFIAPLGICLVVDWWRQRTWTSFGNGVRVLIPIVFAGGLILGRNMLHVGSLFGRPKAAMKVAAPIAEQITWTASALTGVSLSAISAGNLLVFISAFGVAITFPVWLTGMRRPNQQSSVLALLPTIYVAFSIISLAGCSAAFGFTFVQPRYFVAIVPFAVISLATGLNGGFKHLTHQSAKWVPAGLLLLCFSGQFRTLWYVDKPLMRNRVFRTHLQAQLQPEMQKQPGPQTIQQLLQTSTSQQHPLLTDSPHEVALVIDRPVIGIGTANFSRKQLTSDDALKMMKTFGARQVLLMKVGFDESDPLRSNQPFFVELKANKIPQWLRSVYSDENIGLFERID